MKDRQIIRVILLGVVAIMGLVGIQTYWVTASWRLNQAEFDEKIHRVLLKVARAMAQLNSAELPQRDLIKKRSSNYFVVNVDNEIDPQMLEFFLQKELEAAALNLDFEYAVYDCTSDQMVYGDYCSFDPNRTPPDRAKNLPVHHGFTYYFGVRFPTRFSHLVGLTKLSGILSLIMLLTIFFFAYSMIVILRQKRLTELQKDFINNMTHEFKTPLATMEIAAGVFQQAEEVAQNPRLARYAHILREQNQRLAKQIERVLQVARFEQNQFELRSEVLSLHEVIREVAQAEELRFLDKNGTLELRLQAVQDWIAADRLHLSNVIHSLLDNALKYSDDSIRAEIHTTTLNNAIQVSIVDHGIGIAPEHQARVFDKFYRVPTGNVHNVKGFGLGLYYVKRICEAHGWRVSLKSQPGEGTAFQLLIPLARKNPGK